MLQKSMLTTHTVQCSMPGCGSLFFKEYGEMQRHMTKEHR